LAAEPQHSFFIQSNTNPNPNPNPNPTPPHPQENDLDGAIPIEYSWRALHTLRVGNNTFDRISDEFYLMYSMLLLDAMNNTWVGGGVGGGVLFGGGGAG